MSRRGFGVAMTAGLAVACVSGWLAAAPKPEDAIRYRQGVLNALGWNVGEMGAMVKGDIDYDQARFAFLAKRASQLSPMAHEGFIEGSDEGETDAKPEIWDNWADFEKRMKSLNEATAKLAEVAAGGDEQATKAQFGETVKVCKGCHDEYRVEH